MRPGTRSGDPYAPWWTHNIVVFDVETTGLNDSDRIIELGLARFENGKLVDEWGTLIYPDREIPPEATAIHGISTLDVSTAPPFVATLGPVSRIARNAWPAAYNADFDKRFWANELGRLCLDPLHTPIFDPEVRWLDPLVWTRQLDGVWAKNKLSLVSERYGIQLTDAHRATADAVAAGRILFESLRDEMPPVTMTELLRRQQMFANEHDGTRRSWFAKKGIPYR